MEKYEKMHNLVLESIRKLVFAWKTVLENQLQQLPRNPHIALQNMFTPVYTVAAVEIISMFREILF